jgi:hypothetical protein
MFNSIENEEYKIEVDKDNGAIFTVIKKSDDGENVIEHVQSIKELINDKYMSNSQREELKQIADQEFKEDVNELETIYYSITDEDKRLFGKYFDGISFSYKISKVLSKEIQKKIIDQINEKMETKIPIYIEGNKLVAVFNHNPLEYIKEFKGLYSKILSEGNYSLIKRAIEFGKIINDIQTQMLNIINTIEIYE